MKLRHALMYFQTWEWGFHLFIYATDCRTIQPQAGKDAITLSLSYKPKSAKD